MLIPRKTSSLSARDCYVEELRSVVELEQKAESLNVLAGQVAESNVFFESFMLFPAFRHLINETEAAACRFYLVWSTNEAKPKLIGFLPFMERAWYHGFPIRHLVSLYHCHCYLRTPLICSGMETRCWEAFQAHISKSNEYSFFRLSTVGGESSVYNEAIKVSKSAGQNVVETDKHVRTCMKPESSFSEYSRLHIARKVSKDIRRKFRRLAEKGEVRFEVMTDSNDLSDWVMEFMELEAKGWKGRQRVAIINNVNHMSFLREVCKLAVAQKKLHLFKLTLNGKAIAMKCAFQSKDTLFAFKIAYDEALAACSPGQLLEYEHIQWLCNQPEIRWADSCMKPNDFMIARLWKDSRIIRFANISCSGRASKVLISLVPLVKRVRDFVVGRG